MFPTVALLLACLSLHGHILVSAICTGYGASPSMPAQSCHQLKNMNAELPNGIYYIQDGEGNIFPTYCDMITGGGGWTLVASVHENFLTGKCTLGDRWSSQHGNNEDLPHGEGNWENRNIFGAPQSATSDDYKSTGYFTMMAKDIMIWHVPNETPLHEYESKAFMKYHTNTAFLTPNGGNLQKLYAEHFPLRDNAFIPIVDNGPAIPVVWDRGDDDFMVENTPQKLRVETAPGYIQFRAINYEKSALALCPGVKMVGGEGNAEHVCVGGTAYHNGHEGAEKYCGDFAAKDYDGYATDIGSSSNLRMTESVVMIFYR